MSCTASQHGVECDNDQLGHHGFHTNALCTWMSPGLRLDPWCKAQKHSMCGSPVSCECPCHDTRPVK